MVTIRQATVKDADCIIDFQIRMALETERLQLNHTVVSAGVRAVFEDSRKGAYWLAEEANGPIAVLLTTPEWSDWRNGTVLWIQSVYVVPESRRKGVFGKMYHAMKRQVLDDNNLKGLRLYVDKHNKPAQITYGRNGMSNEHYLMYEWMKA